MVWLIAAMVITLADAPTRVQAKNTLSKPVITKLTSGKNGQVKIGYKKVPKNGKCQIQISKEKNFKTIIKKQVVTGKRKQVTLKNLSSGTYYVRIRSEMRQKKKKRYSSWSKRKSIVVKGISDQKKREDTTENEEDTSEEKKDSKQKQVEEDWYMKWLMDQFDQASTPSPSQTQEPSKPEQPTPDPSNPSTPEPAGPTKEPQPAQPMDINEGWLRVSDQTLFYDGTPKMPSVTLYYGGNYLMEGTDYILTAQNNVDAGTASLHIQGIGKYTGECTRDFTIEKALPDVPKFTDGEAKVGEEIAITFGKGAEGEYEYEVSPAASWDTEQNYTEERDGKLYALKTGICKVSIKFPESRNYRAAEYDLGKLSICDDENPEGGFFQYAYSVNNPYKKEIQQMQIENGTGQISIYYRSNASDAWLDEHMTFTAEDVTPPAYASAMKWLGQDRTSPSVVSVTNTTEQYRESDDYGRTVVVGPCSEEGIQTTDVQILSSRRILVKAGAGVRVCKINAYRDGVLYDFIYVATDPVDAEGNKIDENSYKQMRHNIEAKIWKDSMTNYQKLNALASYIKNTTHYPGYGCTKKEKNPTFWNNFSVEGVQLYFTMFDRMSTLNRIMDLQGGITTCQAVDIVSAAATEDLGLPYLYDADTKTIADGEGVWLATGSYSSNPSAPNHISVIYKDANENKTFIDAQGLMVDSSCERHACLDSVIHEE